MLKSMVCIVVLGLSISTVAADGFPCLQLLEATCKGIGGVYGLENTEASLVAGCEGIDIADPNNPGETKDTDVVGAGWDLVCYTAGGEPTVRRYLEDELPMAGFVCSQPLKHCSDLPGLLNGAIAR